MTVRSNSNAGENGIAKEADRAAILQIDPATGQLRLCLRPAQSELPWLACQQRSAVDRRERARSARQRFPPTALRSDSPQRYMGGAFIGQRGSWNCNPRSEYKVIFVPFADGHPSGMPEDILIGFVNANSNALERPVGATVNWPVRCSWLTTSAVLSGA